MYDHNCHICGSPFTSAAQTARYCDDECRARGAKQGRKHREFAIRKTLLPKTDGGPLLRLSDIPPAQRMAAFRLLVDSGELTEDEVPLAFAAALEPGDLSMRAA